MITRPTTLILGAGASAPFGFPTGYQLLQRVLEVTRPNHNINSKEHFEQFQHTRIDVESFYKALLKSGAQSVDSFLERRPEYVSIGKMAMAIVLISYENEWELVKHDGKSWYEYLFNHLNTHFDDFGKNKLNILTFNYDRSLEHFLLAALVNMYGKPIEQCVEMVKTVPIIHLHGDLGGLPELETGNIRDYNPDVNRNSLRIASERIKIVHEGLESAPQFRQARDILNTSEVICFLGFGYHPLNMRRLGFERIEPSQFTYAGKDIRGTTYGLTDAECNQINKKYGLGLRNFGAHLFHQLEVLQFLREMGTLHGN
jgi:hypothetical protein